jgi:hypothetical protein
MTAWLCASRAMARLSSLTSRQLSRCALLSFCPLATFVFSLFASSGAFFAHLSVVCALPCNLCISAAEDDAYIFVAAQEDKPIQAYQATFDLPEGDWVNVALPWHEFVPVDMAKWNPVAGPLDPSRITSIGLVYSRFDLNGVANPNYRPGGLQPVGPFLRSLHLSDVTLHGMHCDDQPRARAEDPIAFVQYLGHCHRSCCHAEMVAHHFLVTEVLER